MMGLMSFMKEGGQELSDSTVAHTAFVVAAPRVE